MKKICTLLVMLSAFAMAATAQLPEFSTADAPKYYKIKFTQGDTYLQSNGTEFMTNEAAASKDEQLFAFIGTQSSCKILCKDGYYLNSKSGTATNGQSGTFVYGATTGAAFCIQSSTVNTGQYVISKTTDKTTGLNTWGGSSAGHNLGFWSVTDVNDQLIFVDEADIPDYSTLDALIATEYTQTTPKPTSWTAPNPLTLWYNVPATLTSSTYKWMEYSLPIGNGHLGASLFGGVHADQLQLNEKSLWSGTSTIKGNPQHGYYRNLGSLYVIDETGDCSTFKNYKRWLDIEEGVGGVDFEDADGNAYLRRYFASEPNDAIVAYYEAPEGKKLAFQVSYYAGEAINATKPAYEGNQGCFIGYTDLLKYNTTFRVVPVGAGATIIADAEGVHVANADKVIVILTAMTDYDGTNMTTFSTGVGNEGLAAQAKEILDNASALGYDDLLAAHVENFKSYMGRVKLQLSTASTAASSTKTTEALVTYYNNSETNSKSYQGLFLEQLYFAYGRYLEISSSRGKQDVPNNLQGIWNDRATAPWNSDIHTNINIQMNYWPSEPTNLSECHLPFLNYISNMVNSPGWKQAASNAGQSVGWTVHTESNIFGGMSSWMGNYTIANAWYVTHLWQHYRYTLDKEYLERVFPAMWSASQYWAERLVLASDGTYECPNEYSPEHGPGSQNATAHSQQLCRELFENTLAAIEVLGNESKLNATWLKKIKDRYSKLDLGLATETYTSSSSWGSGNLAYGKEILKEWKYSDFTTGENGHRHQSHLMCLYPFNQVYPGSEYFDAAVNSLAQRGDNSTGWSMGWRINLWARAQNGDHARTLLHNALKHSTSYGTDQSRGGIYYNLFDSHAPFQIDGNFGACAGIAEMLMQSATGTISILPALPSAWPKGSVSGLKAVGDFEVAIEWAKKKATLVTIKNNQGQPLKVKVGENDLTQVLVAVNGVEVVAELNEDGSYSIPTDAAGDVVTIDFTQVPSAISSVTEKRPFRSTEVYDLQGRKVTNAKNGVFVFNGQKVLM